MGRCPQNFVYFAAMPLMNSFPGHPHTRCTDYSRLVGAPYRSASMLYSDTAILPVIIPIAECSHWDGKRLPNWIEGVLHHFRLVADGEPGQREER